MYLSKFAKNICILIRKEDLGSTMSAYLIDQIKKVERICVRGKSEVIEAKGNGKLEHIVIQDIETKECELVEADALYIFIGAKPYKEWLGTEIMKNDKGFIETGSELQRYDSFGKIWKMERDPHLLKRVARVYLQPAMFVPAP